MTPDQIIEARQMRERGVSFVDIGQHFGVHRETIRYQIVPESRERRKAKERERFKAKRPSEKCEKEHCNAIAKEAAAFKRSAEVKPNRVPLEDLQARFAEIPKHDTRDLTGRLMGDPLPGRRALDMRAQ